MSESRLPVASEILVPHHPGSETTNSGRRRRRGPLLGSHPRADLDLVDLVPDQVPARSDEMGPIRRARACLVRGATVALHVVEWNFEERPPTVTVLVALAKIRARAWASSARSTTSCGSSPIGWA